MTFEASDGYLLGGFIAASLVNLYAMANLVTSVRRGSACFFDGDIPEIRCHLLAWTYPFELVQGLLLVFLSADEGVSLLEIVATFAVPAAASTALVFVVHRSLTVVVVNVAVKVLFVYIAVTYVVDSSVANWLIFGYLGLNEAAVATSIYFLEELPPSLVEALSEEERMPAEQEVSVSRDSAPLASGETFTVAARMGGVEVSLAGGAIARAVVRCLPYDVDPETVALVEDVVEDGIAEVFASLLSTLVASLMYEKSLARTIYATALYSVGPFVMTVFVKMRYKEPFRSFPKYKTVGLIFLVICNGLLCAFWLSVAVTTVLEIGWRPFDVGYSCLYAAFCAFCTIPRCLDRLVSCRAGNPIDHPMHSGDSAGTSCREDKEAVDGQSSLDPLRDALL